MTAITPPRISKSFYHQKNNYGRNHILDSYSTIKARFLSGVQPDGIKKEAKSPQAIKMPIIGIVIDESNESKDWMWTFTFANFFLIFGLVLILRIKLLFFA
ncbi:hypothetical protein [Mycoplasmoides pneumoniae]|nr:hypothetical protein [Mycoplasmoides pneumoniae]